MVISVPFSYPPPRRLAQQVALLEIEAGKAAARHQVDMRAQVWHLITFHFSLVIFCPCTVRSLATSVLCHS